MIMERLSPGAMLDEGRFQVKRAIKAGGMGAVYEVIDLKLGGKTFALKEMLNPAQDVEGQQLARERFLSEVEVMRGLRHPNIPKVGTSFFHGRSFYFVMEMIHGVDLSQRLKEQGAPGLPPARVVGWMLQLLDALAYLHARTPPVVHRDIKPSNLLLCEEENRVVLIDFGISAASNPGDGLWIGTPGYAPAEQQYGRPEPRSDLYALGATMHQLISGVKPKDFEFARLDELGIEADPAIQKAINAATQAFPQDRVANAEAFAASLRKVANIDMPSSTAAASAVDFDGACESFKNEVLDPRLKELIRRYGNECHTRFLPPALDYLVFTLAYPTPFELQVIKDEDQKRVAFRVKDGVLDAKTLGTVDPTAADREASTDSLLAAFLSGYEEAKSSGFGFGF